MDNGTLLVIPSRNRAKWLDKCKNHTLKTVGYLKPEFWIRNDDPQLNDYKRYYKKYSSDDSSMQHFVVYNAIDILGAAQTYDYIIDSAIELGFERLMILDDDLTFSMRNPILHAKPDYKKCTRYELTFLLDEAMKLVCPEMPLMSFTPIMTRTQSHIIMHCKPMMMAYMYYLPHFKEHIDHRFWKGQAIEARCDLNLTLTMLTQGYFTGFNTTLFIPDNVNNPGGCSTYRNLDFESASVNYLRIHFPEFVTLHTKKGWIDDPNVIRLAPRIGWKKAFNEEAFQKNFGYRSNKFIAKSIINFSEIYSDFIGSIRNEHSKS